jgi:hypothetical protein
MKKILLLIVLLASGIISGYAQSSSQYYPGSYYWPPHIYEYNKEHNQLPERRMNNHYGYRDHHYDNYQRRDACGDGHQNSYNGGYPHRTTPMSDANFRTLLNYIGKVNFDDSKLNQAKLAIRNNTMSSAQIKELMQKLTFDSNKLELAKYAFPYVYDKGMYFLVGEGLTFSSSRDELNEYLLSIGY